MILAFCSRIDLFEVHFIKGYLDYFQRKVRYLLSTPCLRMGILIVLRASVGSITVTLWFYGWSFIIITRSVVWVSPRSFKDTWYTWFHFWHGSLTCKKQSSILKHYWQLLRILLCFLYVREPCQKWNHVYLVSLTRFTHRIHTLHMVIPS